MNLLWRLIRTQLKPYWRALLVRILIAAAVASTPYAFSFLGKWLVDEALQVTGPPKTAQPTTAQAGGGGPPVGIEWKAKTPDEKLRLVLLFFVASIAMHVVVTGLSAVSELLNSRTNEKLAYELRSAVNEKLSRMEMGLFTREQVGQLMTRTMDDTAAIPGNLTNLVINVCVQVAMLVLGLVLLLRLNLSMTLVALAALPFYAVSCVVFLPRLRRNAERQRDRIAALTGHVIERLTNISTIKNYAQEQREVETFGRRVEENLALGRRQNRLSLYFGTATTIITAVATLAVLALGFRNIQSQRMRLGEVLAFYQVTAQLFVPISALVGMTTVAQALQVLADRVYGILDMPEHLQTGPDVVDPADIRGHVEFRNVSLRYADGGPFAVKNVTLDIPAGTAVCVVGPTGCGKSALLSLLTRLYDPTEGTVHLDGIDVRKLRLRRLRRSVGNILHDCQIFSGTIGENLRFGAPKASQEEVEHAARLVGLHDDIEALPGGYEARIGRQGAALDREQLARLTVARALVTRPAIVTIDDTFAAIDPQLEQQLRAAIRTALADRTVIVATSRLSICEQAEMVVVMRKGEIIEIGTHQTLMAEPGVYRRMYTRQMGMDDPIAPAPS